MKDGQEILEICELWNWLTWRHLFEFGGILFGHVKNEAKLKSRKTQKKAKTRHGKDCLSFACRSLSLSIAQQDKDHHRLLSVQGTWNCAQISFFVN